MHGAEPRWHHGGMTDAIPPLRWHTLTFAQLDAATLYALLKLRSEVFVVEQQCVYLDPDGKDAHPDVLHVIGRGEDDGIAAYLRILPAGLSYPQVSFGRVLTAPAYRGRGLGDPLVRVALDEIERRWPGSDVQIGAQAHLEHYYARHGFVRNSDTYLDDGIPHIDMLRAAGALK